MGEKVEVTKPGREREDVARAQGSTVERRLDRFDDTAPDRSERDERIAQAAPAAPARGDQARLAEHLQVVAQQVPRDRNLLLELAHTPRRLLEIRDLALKAEAERSPGQAW